ncbi:PREDICTED: olfactory receptor 2A1/2A42-like [Chrysochloris asiatica]|uniref:Olfactory receptor n=1 Tax=Chrysochloris asiatica TaxID=185453 RepID=A0A9B0WVB8_CHRAS|nr:PREDICTED: olfactory receptor 2A1/2A42-like [Chrysochloris asiatica]
MAQAAWNGTGTPELVLVGLWAPPALRPLLWTALLAAYVATVLGNGALVGLITLDQRLHRPMYRLLTHLALLDTAYVSTTLPQALAHMVARRATLSLARCGAQLYVGISLGSCEAILLAAMALDRCLAVCQPLRYAAIMTSTRCATLALAAWTLGFLLSVPNAVAALRLPFCPGRPPVDHFFCELPAVLRTVCADTTANQMLVYGLGTPILLIPLSFILTTYTLILSAVGKLPSAKSRLKALSTCSSHLAVVGLFYGTVTAMYLGPRNSSALPAKHHKLVAVFYLVVTPVLNPLIYSLRNREVHAAVRYALARLRGTRTGLD